MRSVVASSLGNSTWATFQLRYTIWSNLAGNLLSMYSGHKALFQFDANGGAPAAVVNMLYRSLDSTLEFRNETRITILPALSPSWPSSSFTGGRARDGIGISLVWENSVPQSIQLIADKAVKDRTVALISNTFQGKRAEGAGVIQRSGTEIAVLLRRGQNLKITFT
ncbi:glycoside hydrolase family 95 protein [Atractiella rhizophila]|nr:glycoside hydrolase family 95 protein [Atractiella rhizophila]